MSELTTRAEDLAVAIEEKCCRGDYVYVGSVATKLIEQALLAERRLAMEEAAKLAEAMAEPCIDHTTCFDASHRKARKLANQLRAAAEKEVGK